MYSPPIPDEFESLVGALPESPFAVESAPEEGLEGFLQNLPVQLHGLYTKAMEEGQLFLSILTQEATGLILQGGEIVNLSNPNMGITLLDSRMAMHQEYQGKALRFIESGRGLGTIVTFFTPEIGESREILASEYRLLGKEDLIRLQGENERGELTFGRPIAATVLDFSL